MAHHLQLRQRWGRRSVTTGLLPAPELLKQLGTGVGAHQHQMRALPHQRVQQGHPVGVHIALNHKQWVLQRHQLSQRFEERFSEGGPWGMHQHSWDCRCGAGE